MLVKTKKAKSPKPKRAVIFIEDGSFSYDNRVIREAQALVNAGWDITVICPKDKGDPFYRRVSNRLRVYHYYKPATESIIGHVYETLFSLIFGFGLTFYVHLRHGFSVFQACNPMDILWLIALPYKAIGKKFIFDHHDLVPELLMSRNHLESPDLVYRIARVLERCSFKLADAVISTNESYRDIALDRGGKIPGQVFVVRNGPDLNKFKPVCPKRGLKKKGEILVGYLGNMNPQDGVEYLLSAAEIIRDNFGAKNIKFVFVGGGGSQKRLMLEARNRCLEKDAIFTGRIPDDEMLGILSACDICVQPDPKNPLNDMSTMNKALEYMALEKPVVAFDLKETRVSCGSAAIYAKPNDPRDLAEKIVYLAAHEELRHYSGKMGRQRIEKELAWEYSVPYLIEAYGFVIGR